MWRTERLGRGARRAVSAVTHTPEFNVATFALGVSITVAIEGLATRGYWIGNWNYLPTMPLVPGAGIGLAPLLQWVVLPLLTLWFVRRQLAHRPETIPQKTTVS